MKKLYSVAALAAAFTAGTALAADLPSRKGPPPALLPPPPLWTGFYAGVNAGGTWSQSNSISVASFQGPCDITRIGCGLSVPSVGTAMSAAATFVAPSSSNGGFIGGGQIGYNWQFNNIFVAGVEADIHGVTNNDSGSAFVTGALAGAPTLATPRPLVEIASVRRSLDYLGTVRGRLGYLFTPTLLVYASGGLAYGGVHSSVGIFQSFNTDPSVTPALGAGAFSDTRVGWTVGGGLEWMFLPNWSAKAEYLYYDLGNVTYSVTPLTSLSTISGTVVGSAFPQAQTRFDGHVVRAGLNYHFNWATAPVVARY